MHWRGKNPVCVRERKMGRTYCSCQPNRRNSSGRFGCDSKAARLIGCQQHRAKGLSAKRLADSPSPTKQQNPRTRRDPHDAGNAGVLVEMPTGVCPTASVVQRRERGQWGAVIALNSRRQTDGQPCPRQEPLRGPGPKGSMNALAGERSRFTPGVLPLPKTQTENRRVHIGDDRVQ
jgi:hypothetical protein